MGSIFRSAPELGGGEGLPEHPTRTAPGRDPAAPGCEALDLPPARGPFIFCCVFVSQADRIFFFFIIIVIAPAIHLSAELAGVWGGRSPAVARRAPGQGRLSLASAEAAQGSEESALMCGPDLSANQPQTSYLPGTSAGQRSPGAAALRRDGAIPGGGESSREQRDGAEQSTTEKGKEETGKGQETLVLWIARLQSQIAMGCSTTDEATG